MQQVAHATQHSDVRGSIEPPPARSLHRPDEGELGFPEPQDVLRHVKLVRRFGDGPKGFRPLGHVSERLHRASARSTRAFIPCEARKPITRRGSMAAGSPVLGLRPMRARLARTWNTPKPD